MQIAAAAPEYPPEFHKKRVPRAPHRQRPALTTQSVTAESSASDALLPRIEPPTHAAAQRPVRAAEWRHSRIQWQATTRPRRKANTAFRPCLASPIHSALLPVL